MAFLLRRGVAKQSNRLAKPSLFQHCYATYFTGQRYQGYVSYFNSDDLFGFLVREDLPEREYYFHSADIHCETIPRVRPLQSVEFTITETKNNNFLAKDISALDGNPIVFNHPNMRLQKHERTRKLSEMPDSATQRHKGVVVATYEDNKGGLIVPDRLNYDVCRFKAHELQTTGSERLDRFAEVEFYVRAGGENYSDNAVCVTRSGGGLITAERRESGSRRRQLGSMYGPNDVNARLPHDFKQNRTRGYMVHYDHNLLYGFIVPFDNPADQLFVHIDDCHCVGKRSLRRYQEVEFVAVTDETTGKSKAMHVTGPNATVIRYISANHYVPANLCTQQFEADPNVVRSGSVMVHRRGTDWFLIKPDQQGYQPVLSFRSCIRALGRRNVNVGDAVQFSVDTYENRREEEVTLRARAYPVMGGGGKPIVAEGGRYGRYLLAKVNLPYAQTDLPEAPLTEEGQTMEGYVSSYSATSKKGTIEVVAPDGVRYRKLMFDLNDAQLESDINIDEYFIRHGASIQCGVAKGEPTDGVAVDDTREPVLTQKATNVVSPGANVLELQIRTERREYWQKDNKDNKATENKDEKTDSHPSRGAQFDAQDMEKLKDL